MDPKEIRTRYEQYLKLYDIRTVMYKQLLVLNAPEEILEPQQRLVDEAIRGLRLYAKPFEEIKKEFPDIFAQEVISDALEAQEHEEFEQGVEQEWIEYTHKLVEQLKKDFPYAEEVLVEDIVVKVVSLVKEKAVLIMDK